MGIDPDQEPINDAMRARLDALEAGTSHSPLNASAIRFNRRLFAKLETFQTEAEQAAYLDSVVL